MEVTLLILALLFSAFFSGSETALISASRIKLEVWIRHGVKGAEKAMGFIQNPDRFLITTLIGNNIAVVTASSLLAFYLAKILTGFQITLVSAVILLIIGEIIPKSIARDRATNFTIRSVFLLRFFHLVFYPINWIVMRLSAALLHLLGMQDEKKRSKITRKDLELLIRQSDQSGVMDEEERDLISKFLLRTELKVKEIMIPRTDMAVLKLSDNVNKAVTLFESTGYSRIPVIDKSIDKVVGMVTSMDLILENPESLKSIIREVLFVPETGLISGVLRELQLKRVGLAIVVDEYGGTEGMVTVEDIIEEFFGEIQDEFDDEEQLFRKTGAKQIEVKAKVNVSELNDSFQLNLREGDYQTLGGLMMDHLGHIPKRGEKVEMEHLTLTVLSATKRRVNWVRIHRKNV